LKLRKIHFTLIITILLTVGFSATSLISYMVANKSLNEHIRSNTLPLTSDNIYSEIRRDLLQPIFISSLMAQDTFVRDWVLAGEQQPEQMIRYLKTIQNRYDTVTAFFISENSKNYYHSSGILKQVHQNNPADSWYFRVKDLTSDFEINIDADTADRGRTSIFINHQIFDFDHNYLGAIGVGLASEAVRNMIETYQSRYGRQIYFVNKMGQVTLHGRDFDQPMNIRKTEGLNEIATQVLTSPSGSYSYMRDGQEVFLKTRLVPEFNWFLLVEQEDQAEASIQHTLIINLLLSLLTTIIVVVIAHIAINRYQRNLNDIASLDKLTGITSRNGFDSTYERTIRTSERRGEKVCALLVDIDNFKAINDEYGHLAGDEVLSNVAQLMQQNIRNSDQLCRWGGEEFLILLPDCDLTFAQALAERIRIAIEQHDVEIGSERIQVTASFGATLYRDSDNQHNLFERADQALYAAKEKGRNRVEIA